MNRYLSIQEAGLMIGVTTTTLRRWEKSGLLKPHHRTLGNHNMLKGIKVRIYLYKYT